MENTQAALRTLNLPDDFSPWNGQIKTKTERKLVERITTDYTKLIGIKPTVTTTYEIRKTTTAFGHYGLNLLADYIHAYGYDYIDANTLDLPRATYTIPSGPFAGKTFWRAESRVNIVDIGPELFDINVAPFPFSNTIFGGNPEPTNGENPEMTILREQVIITKTFNNSSNPAKTYPKYSKDVVLAKTGWSLDQLTANLATTFSGKRVDSLRHITSTGTRVVQSGDLYTGEIYINGFKVTQEINPSGLITAYGSVYPGLVGRWRLYNGVVHNSARGTTWEKQIELPGNMTLLVKPGETYSYDASTNTLTYNDNVEASLWFEFEFKPLTGKGWSNETIIVLP